MERSKVYFTDMRTHNRTSLPEKLKKLIRMAGIGDIDFDSRFAAIKIHFGEAGNLAFLRPNYAKAVADTVKELGGIPFLTDCNTLYAGTRKHALEHMDTAAENGFSYESTGCRIIIGDGLKGTDDVAVPVVGGELIKEAKIGRAVMDADILISLNHFKGHECTGFGGALKNIGMGCGSRAGKMEQHNSGKPQVNAKKCRGCHMCLKECAHSAILFADGKAMIDHGKCVGCGRCIGACNFDAIRPTNSSANADLCKKMAEYAKAVVDGRPCFHINIATDISPYCDCHGENDAPILPNIGIFASFDPVAIDQACADMCNAQKPMPNSVLGDLAQYDPLKDDAFTSTFPTTDWRVTLEHAEKLGIGTREYELIVMK